MSFLNAWCLAGIVTVMVEILIIHRRRGTLRQICGLAAIEAMTAGHPSWVAALVGHRRYVVPMMIGLWPLVLAHRIGRRA